MRGLWRRSPRPNELPPPLSPLRETRLPTAARSRARQVRPSLGAQSLGCTDAHRKTGAPTALRAPIFRPLSRCNTGANAQRCVCLTHHRSGTYSLRNLGWPRRRHGELICASPGAVEVAQDRSTDSEWRISDRIRSKPSQHWSAPRAGFRSTSPHNCQFQGQVWAAFGQTSVETKRNC